MGWERSLSPAKDTGVESRISSFEMARGASGASGGGGVASSSTQAHTDVQPARSIPTSATVNRTRPLLLKSCQRGLLIVAALVAFSEAAAAQSSATFCQDHVLTILDDFNSLAQQQTGGKAPRVVGAGLVTTIDIGRGVACHANFVLDNNYMLVGTFAEFEDATGKRILTWTQDAGTHPVLVRPMSDTPSVVAPGAS
jgi:hypothetical protein